MGALAPVYDLLTAPLERRVLGHWRRRVWSRVPDAGIGLEIGAGTGANFPCHPGGARVVATDLSHGMLRRALRRRGAGGPALLAADVAALPFPAGTFDFAVATLVFCEVDDPLAGLIELRRVLVPGGRLVLLEHVRPSGWLGWLAEAATTVTAPLLGEHFDRDAEGAVHAAGFEAVTPQWLWRDAVVLLTARAPV